MRPTWRALKFRGSTVLAGTYWLVSQSETQMSFTVNAPFQAVKKQTPHQKNKTSALKEKPNIKICLWSNVNKKSQLVQKSSPVAQENWNFVNSHLLIVAG